MQLSDYIRAEQATQLYRHLKVVIPGTIAISVITVAVLWTTYPPSQLLIWFASSMTIVFLRWWTARRFSGNKDNISNHGYWLKLFVFWAAMTGFNWGLVSVFFFSSDHLIPALLITCLYAGYMSAAMSSHALYMPAFLGFAIPCTILLGAANLYQGGSVHLSILLMVMLYSSVLFSFARNANASFVETKTLYHRNTELMEEITRQKEAAENAVLAKNQFLAAASHDLRQPLHALGLFVDALKPHIESSQGKVIRTKISQSTEALNGLLHGLLDISRLDASVVENRPRHANLNAQMLAIQEEYQSLAKREGITISFDINDSQTVFVDTRLLERVVRNLIDNAMKYSEKGTVTVSSVEDGEYVRISIADNGVGIPKEKQEEVFKEFYQLGNPSRNRQKGLGLGLSIVRRLCALMNVRLEMRSNPGEGTTMHLWVEKGRSKSISSRKKELITSGYAIRVIVIDDEQDILDAMQYMFSSWKCEIRTFLDIQSALEAIIAQTIEPNIVLADFRLGGGESGLDAIEYIRDEMNQNIPAILVTGDTAPDRVKQAQEADVAVMYKPIQPETLRRMVSQMVDEGEISVSHH